MIRWSRNFVKNDSNCGIELKNWRQKGLCRHISSRLADTIQVQLQSLRMRFDRFNCFFDIIESHIIVIPTVQRFTNQCSTDFNWECRLASRCLRSPIKREFLSNDLQTEGIIGNQFELEIRFNKDGHITHIHQHTRKMQLPSTSGSIFSQPIYHSPSG
jgi:hypothetical protein